MRTLSVLLVACALASPVLAEATLESTGNPPARTAAARPHLSRHARHVSLHRRGHAKPAAKAAPATRVSSFTRDPDYPWVLPS